MSGGSRRRRTVLVAVLVVAVLALMVGIPVYLTSVPGFFERYPDLRTQYAPWSESTHLEAGCEDCHVSPGPLPRAAYRARMVGEFYVSLFDKNRVPQVFGEPNNDACQSCHDDLRSVSPKGDLKIPHRAHVQILKMKCNECHNYLVHEKSPEGKLTPPMSGCLKCHDGDTAKNTCTACHESKGAPQSHQTADWRITHAKAAEDPECESCHKWTEDWCADCHRKRPASHSAEWRAEHGAAVEIRRNCEACHDAAFCTRCHGEVPQLNLDPTLKIVQ